MTIGGMRRRGMTGGNYYRSRSSVLSARNLGTCREPSGSSRTCQSLGGHAALRPPAWFGAWSMYLSRADKNRRKQALYREGRIGSQHHGGASQMRSATTAGLLQRTNGKAVTGSAQLSDTSALPGRRKQPASANHSAGQIGRIRVHHASSPHDSVDHRPRNTGLRFSTNAATASR